MSTQKYYKFLDHNLASYHNNGKEFYYPAPTFKDGKWIPTEWIEEKDCEESKEACNKGLHLMKVLIPKYQPYKGNCYEAEGEGLLEEDDDKARFRKVRLLRPVPQKEIIKPNANLSYADLRNANLSYANLRNANLSYANLSDADLRNANLSYADLSYANLWNADLWNADLSYANLWNANLLTSKNLESVRNPNKAYWNKFTKVTDDFKKLLSKNRFSNVI